MPLRKGDSVTLSISPTCDVTQYFKVKPHASITRVLGDNPEDDVEEIRADLNRLVFKAAITEIEVDEKLAALIAEGGWEALLENCKKELYGTPRQTVTARPDTVEEESGPARRRVTDTVPAAKKTAVAPPVRKAVASNKT